MAIEDCDARAVGNQSDHHDSSTSDGFLVLDFADTVKTADDAKDLQIVWTSHCGLSI